MIKYIPIEEKNKDVFVNYLDRAIDLDFNELIFARKPTLKRFPIYTYPQFRLIMLLEGKHTYTILGKNGFEEVVLTPGKVLFSLRGGATGLAGNHHNESAKMLSVVFWSHFVRFLISSYDNEEDECKLIWHHSHSAIGRAGVYILKTLDELAHDADPDIQAYRLADVLLRLCRKHLLADNPQTVTKSYKTYQNIMVYLCENFGEDINRESVAHIFGISPPHISKLFATYNEHNFNTVLKMLRLEHAEELLKNTTFLISEIAEQCGFASVGYFIKAFRLFYGETPGNFRRKATTE